MRDPRITAIDRASLVAWPVTWALGYYAATLAMVWGRVVHPIQAMFLMFGMMATALMAAVAAAIWLALLARREREAPANALTFRAVAAFGAVGGAVPMTASVALYNLAFADDAGAVEIVVLVALAAVAGAACALCTSGIVALRRRAAARV